MKKKWALFIIVFTLLSFIFIFTISQKERPLPSSSEKTPAQVNSEASDQQDQHETSEDTNQDAEPEQDNQNGITDQIKNVVTEAIQIFQKETNIVAIGDSLTQGVGDEAGNGGYVGILENRLDSQNVKVSIENFGKRGNRTDQLYERLNNEDIVASIEQADIVLITIGANDIMKIVKDNFMNLTEQPFIEARGPYRHRLEQILQQIQTIQPDAQVYLLGFFNPFEKYFNDIEALDRIMTRWNNESKNVANQFEQTTFIPMKNIFQGRSENVFAEDNFHPNQRGYRIMAERVISYLQEDVDAGSDE
ncbi:hypothetical protein J416_03946 [Gracilibacillus halophilus YIM-C55.5]|uniref:SGNH hydrolase-type esterase domain-containing protein n=1 Tax=Gracilibacillus halophilus YIM-C55.5 TaxID=1308866 RepID=N4WNH6_9BACI|nr:GDSL-type esterase/lipase family protein [Gracilibacillus halophilus]ENH97687.1 hypothetical protein J416_03946 [Gracilibacillus halophilus YIM-C55.5]